MAEQKIVTYLCGNKEFKILATDDIHYKLRTDDKYASECFGNLLLEDNEMETTDVLDDTFGEDNPALSENNVFHDPDNPTGSDNEPEEIRFWNDARTKLLLDEYKKRVDRFRDPKIKKNKLWREIALVFQQHKLNVSSEEVDKKMRNMKITYRKKKQNKKATGQGRSDWPWLKMMDEIFCNDESVTLTDNIIESFTPNTERNTLPLNLSNKKRTTENNNEDNAGDNSSTDSSIKFTMEGNNEKGTKNKEKNFHARKLYGQRNKFIHLKGEKKEIFEQIAKNSSENNNILVNNANIWKTTMDSLINVMKEKNEIMKERNSILSDLSNKLDRPKL